jgi:hypothetical protein
MHERVVHASHGRPATDGNFEYGSSLVVTDGFPVVDQPADANDGEDATREK